MAQGPTSNGGLDGPLFLSGHHGALRHFSPLMAHLENYEQMPYTSSRTSEGVTGPEHGTAHRSSHLFQTSSVRLEAYLGMRFSGPGPGWTWLDRGLLDPSEAVPPSRSNERLAAPDTMADRGIGC